MRIVTGSILFLLLLGATAAAPPVPAARPYLTRPALSPDGSTIAFVSEGAIWTVPAKGGIAHILVSGQGNLTSPVYSPGGDRLAFESDRSGANNIYVLDLRTGAEKQLTFNDAGVELDAWSRNGRWIYFSSTGDNIIYMDSIYRISPEGGTPMPVTSELYINEHYAAPAPEGHEEIAFTGHGVANWQWWRKGHSHLDDSEIWLLNFDHGRHYRQISAGNAEELWPMWSANGREVYYVSDRTGFANIWVTSLHGAPRQVTHFTDDRLVWPRIGYNGKTIVFARHFGIWKLDTKTGKASEVPITLRGAANAVGVTHRVFQDHFQELALSPDGKKIAFIAHGTVFAAPSSEPGRAIEITHSPFNHSELAWSPGSRRLVFVSDRGDAPHLYLYNFSTRKQTEIVSQGEDYSPVFSPNGKELAFKRDGHQLCALDFATSQVRVLAQGNFSLPPINDPHAIAWSPDSRWIAYATYGPRMFRNVDVVAAAGGPSHPVSFVGNLGGFGPVWSPNGKFLLYATGQRTKMVRVARIDLIPHVPQFEENQFWKLFKKEQPQAGQPNVAPGKQVAGAKSQKKKKIQPVKIDFQHIRRRFHFLSIGLNVRSVAISPNGKWALVTSSVAGQENLYVYSLNELSKKPKVARQLTSTPGPKTDAQFTPDSKDVFYLDHGRIFEVALATRKVKPVAATAGLNVNFAREKFEVFDQAWRYLRDNYCNPDMNGVNWNAVHTEYEPYVAGATNPHELYGLLNLMIGELNSSHSGLFPPRGKSKPFEGRIGLAFDVAAYQQSGTLHVSAVVPRSPAAIAGIKPGDELLAIDGTPIGPHTNYHQLLAHRTGHLVTLTLGGANPRKVDVKPVGTGVMKNLLYHEWVEANRAYVARLSDGKLGYANLQSMEPSDLQHLNAELSSTTQTLEGVVIDIRSNTGGFVNPYAIDVLARRHYLTIEPRGLPAAPMRILSGQRALERPTILVVNRGTLSDGEDFTQGYRTLHLGKVVGEPTAGWIIYTWAARLIDGSVVRLPHARVVTNSGHVMEMHPRPVDIRVARPIGQTYEHKDSQLAAAVHALLQQIQSEHKGAAK
jgi:Tol biopolymer transport system component